MKVLITNYTFTAAAKTISFNDFVSIDIDAVLLITNVVDNIIIYDFSEPTLGGTVATNVLTLTYSTVGMSDSDGLQIWYWDSAADLSVDTGLLQGITQAQFEVEIDEKLGDLGQKVMAGSAPVVIASDQSTLPVSVADGSDIALGAKADISATTDTGTFSLISFFKRLLSKLTTQLPAALGQTTMSASLPVTIASDQTVLPVSVTGYATDNTSLYNNTLSAVGAITGIDTTGYSSIIFQFTGDWIGSILIEGSNDNSIWGELMILSVDEFTMQDIITQNGVYQLKTSAKYIRINVTSLQIESITTLVLGRTVSGIDGADILSYAMDKNNNSPLYVDAITDIKKDSGRAIIPSDAPNAISFNTAFNGLICVIDTTGYQSLSLQIASIGSGTVTWTCSNDGINYTAFNGWVVNGTNSTGSAVTSAATTGMWLMPCVARYIKLILSGGFTGSPVVGTCYLRQYAVSNSLVAYPFVNAVFNNAAPLAYTTTTAAGVSSINSNGGTLSVGGTQLPASTTVPSPIIVGGRTAPTPAALAGTVRTILTDITGRPLVLLQGDGSMPVTAQGTPVTPVQDISTFDGQTKVELLWQLLIEQKITNQYLYDLPLQLQRVFETLNNSNNRLQYPFTSSPEEFRNDSSVFNQ